MLRDQAERTNQRSETAQSQLRSSLTEFGTGSAKVLNLPANLVRKRNARRFECLIDSHGTRSCMTKDRHANSIFNATIPGRGVPPEEALKHRTETFL